MSQKIPRIVADFQVQLSTAIAIGGTSFSISSNVDDDGNIISNGLYAFTVDNGTSNKEYFFGTLTGTAVSAVSSISRQGVLSSGAVRAHRVGASVILTDFSAIQALADAISGRGTLDGTNPLSYDVAPTLSGSTQLATVAYVLSVVTGGTITFDGEIVAGVAAATITKGQYVYLNSLGQWDLASSAASATCLNVQLGVAQINSTSGNAIAVLVSGLDKTQNSLGAAGTIYYLQDTPGAIGTSVGTISVDVGQALASGYLQVKFQLKHGTVFSSVAGAATAASGTNNGVPIAPSSGAPEIDFSWLPATTGNSDQSQLTQNGTSAAGEANATTKHALLAEKFIAARHSIAGVTLYKSADTGTFTGTVKVAIQADSAGSPSGSDLASITITNASWGALAAGAFSANFSSEYETLVAGSTYWIVITTSTNDNSNHINLGINTAGGYASGALKFQNGTDGWTLITTSILYFATKDGVLAKVPRTSSTDGMIPGIVSKSHVVASDATTSTAMSGNTTETTVYTKNLPAGFFNINSGLRVKTILELGQNGSGGTFTFKVKLNGTVIGSFTSPAVVTASPGADAVKVEAELMIYNAGALNSQVLWGIVRSWTPSFAGAVAGTSPASNKVVIVTGTSAVDTSQPMCLTLTVTGSTNNLSIQYDGAFIEKIGL